MNAKDRRCQRRMKVRAFNKFIDLLAEDLIDSVFQCIDSHPNASRAELLAEINDDVEKAKRVVRETSKLY